jgi:alpha/beta superfamily hydrolase
MTSENNGSDTPATGGNPDDLTLSIQGVRARPGDVPGEMTVELNTTRGVITTHLRPCEGKTGCVVFLGGAGGGVSGPADKIYERLASELIEVGVSSLRVEYREPGEFEESVADALAGCSFFRGLGGTDAIIVGHSFGGAVAIKAGELSELAKGIVAMSSQRHGTQTVHTLKKPLLLIHGGNDEILDKAASQDIFERALEPKRIEILEDTGHGLMEKADEVYDLLRDFITTEIGSLS